MKAVVIGIGNRYRHDDGAGPAVVARLPASAPPGVTLVESDGEPARLLDWWDAPVALVVDALESEDAAPGTVHRAETFETDDGTTTSSHGLGAIDAWALGRALGRLPGRLVVYGIVGDRFDAGLGLSPAVLRAVQEVAAAVVQEVERSTEPCA